MSAEWKFTGTPPLTSRPAAAEALRKLVARLDAPGRSRFGLLEAPPEIASLRAEIPADPGKRAVDSFGKRLAGVLDRIAPQVGRTAGAPSGHFPRMEKEFPRPPKQPDQRKSFVAESGEEAKGTTISNESGPAAKKQIVPIEPDPAQLQAIFHRHKIDPTDPHGQPKMEAQRPNPKEPAPPPSVSHLRAPSVAVPQKSNRQGGEPQTTETESRPTPGSVLITTHGNEFLVERKSPLEIHADSLAEGRSASLGAAIPVEKSDGLRRTDLLRLAAPRRPQAASKQHKYSAKKPEQTNVSAAQPSDISNFSNGPRSFREIGGNPSPSSVGRQDSPIGANAPDSKSGWTPEPLLSRSNATTNFPTVATQRKASERPAFSGQLGQLLARWEDQPSESGENIPSQRHEPVPPAVPNSQVFPSSNLETWTPDPDDFARRVEDTLESVLIREIRRHGLDPEEP